MAFEEFRGKPNEDVTELFRAVRAEAFKHGKLKDDVWMADYCSTLLAGEAEKYYDGLPKEMKSTWSSLRAILEAQYGGSCNKVADRQGRIVVTIADRCGTWYLCRNRLPAGRSVWSGSYTLTCNKADAAIVTAIRETSGLRGLKLRVGSSTYLSLKLYRPIGNDFQTFTNTWGSIFDNPCDGHRPASKECDFTGPYICKGWDIQDNKDIRCWAADFAMLPVVTNSYPGNETYGVDILEFVENPTAFVNEYRTSHGFHRAQLRFEDI